MTKPTVTLRRGDCVSVMRTLDDNSVDAIVTDPPYELNFMGRGWDRSGIANDPDMWAEALRVLKPGGHLLAFSGSRTYHRMVCAIEDAGFEIRDQIMWVYGSGFPKSLDVSKAMDKAAGAEREVVGSKLDRPGYHLDGHKGGEAFGHGLSSSTYDTRLKSSQVTAAGSDLARQWEGWGTALKPAHEPIVVARKPLDNTVSQNVAKWGTGALNIAQCRVGTEGGTRKHDAPKNDSGGIYGNGLNGGGGKGREIDAGRWPSNLIHDGSDEVLDLFASFGEKTSSKRNPSLVKKYTGSQVASTSYESTYGDSGTAARFFYCAKSSKKDRDAGLDDLPATRMPNAGYGSIQKPKLDRSCPRENWTPHAQRNTHPTVKPTDLMAYLCRLVTPPGGTVLDPFMGSGSTGRGAALSGFSFIGIDLSKEYVDIARKRIADARKPARTIPLRKAA